MLNNEINSSMLVLLSTASTYPNPIALLFFNSVSQAAKETPNLVDNSWSA